MKSEPGRSVVSASRSAGTAVSAALDKGALPPDASAGCCALAIGDAATAAAPTAAPFRKRRRLTDVRFEFFIAANFPRRSEDLLLQGEREQRVAGADDHILTTIE